MAENNHISHLVSSFHGRRLPEQSVRLAGYTALIQTYQLQVPLPDILSAISHKHAKYQENHWMMYTTRHAPHDTLYGHLTFALKYEGINLAVLKRLFDHLEANDIMDIVKLEPTGSYSRRIWFLYEWLQETQLSIPNITRGTYIDVVDDRLQYAIKGTLSPRHRVRNNLPGVKNFCPMIRRTILLDQMIKSNLSQQVNTLIKPIKIDILLRAAAFLLLKDSKASYAIEGESPPHTRAERWAHAIGQAGLHPLSHEEFLRLQSIIISDFRFVHFGYRNEGGFIGDHDRSSGIPIPVHISARYQDLYGLMEGLIETNTLLNVGEFDPVLTAAIISFGFIFIHPFEDGNGRMHRYLFHHVLSERNFAPRHLCFPISSVILDRIDEYREILESYSKPRLKLIEWRPTQKGNVEVFNETVDLYRYFDCTLQAEFLYSCIKETIQQTLPDEIDYLKKHDELKSFIRNTLEMPDNLLDLLIRFLIQGKGKLSKRARHKEFNRLTEPEIADLETKYAQIFLTDKD